MKHLFKFLSFAAIAAMTAVSCNKEIETPDLGTDTACPEGYYVEELTAVYPRDPETRTAFNETTGRFAWTEGDELAFHLSNGEYVAAPIDPATGKVKLYLPVGVTRDNYAVYPASAVVDDAAAIGNMKVTLPDTYDISANPNTDYVPTPLVAWNDAENKHLKFEHVGGLLQVNLNVPAGVKTATVSMGKTISGTFSLEDGTGNGIISPGEASAEGITFVLSEDGLAEDTQVKLLTPLPTGSYDYFKVAYDDGFAFSRDLSANPWVFTRSGGKKVSIAEDKFEDPTNYFWIEALEANSVVQVSYGGTASVSPSILAMEFSVDNKRTWSEYDWENLPDIPLANVGDRVYFRGLSNFPGRDSRTGYRKYRVFNGTGKLATGGDIMLLRDYRDPKLNYPNSFNYLFDHNTALVDASQLIIPDSGLQSSDFYMTFMGCTALEKAPALPATKVPSTCYTSMFNGCSSLVNAPELPATEVGSMGYYGMFYQCTGLKKGPSRIAVTKFSSESFEGMFYNCREMEVGPVMEFGNDAYGSEEAFYQMFKNCVSLKTITLNGPTGKVGKSGMRDMFYGCTSLDNINVTLPASEIGVRGYQDMFYMCTSLTNSLESLPATKLSELSCSGMFGYCISLLHGPEIYATTVDKQSCIWMFEQCHSMISATSILPATTLATQCYSGMFANCWALTTAPVLPATTLASYCYGNYAQYYDQYASNHDVNLTGDYSTRYGGMFANCKALTVAPELPATELALGCYYGMFHGCSALVKAPDLPAETVYDDGYFRMFEDCTSLTEASLAATEFPYQGTAYRRGGSRMFYGCTSLQKLSVNFTAWGKCPDWVTGVPAGGKFYKPEALPETYGVSNIPEGWTVYNLEEVGTNI